MNSFTIGIQNKEILSLLISSLSPNKISQHIKDALGEDVKPYKIRNALLEFRERIVYINLKFDEIAIRSISIIEMDETFKGMNQKILVVMDSIPIMSSQIGKSIRLERILDRKTKRTVIIPMDHGITVGPIKGIEDMGKTVDLVAEGGANAVLGHIGLPIYGHRGYGKDIGLILHLNASTTLSTQKDNKVLVNTVEEALRVGADCVSLHVNIGGKDDSSMLEMLGTISRQCRKWGMPLLAMMYPRGENIIGTPTLDQVKMVARIGAELGADIIKTMYTGSIESFKEVVNGCPAPVVIAGGSEMSIRDLLQMTKDSIEAGGVGVAYGRNVFGADDPVALTRAISLIVHDDFSVDEAIRTTKLKVE